MRDIYMVSVNVGGSVFVKTLKYFRSQKGFEEAWGNHWTPVIATSIEDARKQGCKLFLNARPYEMQA